jgi:hypothetical protein
LQKTQTTHKQQHISQALVSAIILLPCSSVQFDPFPRNDNIITISIYNMAAVVGGTNTFLYDVVLIDMTAWSIIMCFSPVEYSIIPEMYNT